MKSRYLVSSLFAVSSIISGGFAYAINTDLYQQDGTVQVKIQDNQTISLMKLKPTAELKKRMALRAMSFAVVADEPEQDFSKSFKPFVNGAPGVVDLGMGNVPVLNQGQHGTCVTFSSTAALDVFINKGDYIDQECSLELDYTMGNNYWEGANTASQVIDPLKENGVIQKGQCFGRTYSLANNAGTESNKLQSVSEYTNVSDKTELNSVGANYFKAITLDDIKTALNNGHRVVMGFPLQDEKSLTISGFPIAGSTMGLWACQQASTPNTEECNLPSDLVHATLPGHEVVVIGYDDNQKLLKIRNSWSETAGDKGDYYMTYKYFNVRAGQNGGADGTEVYN